MIDYQQFCSCKIDLGVLLYALLVEFLSLVRLFNLVRYFVPSTEIHAYNFIPFHSDLHTSLFLPCSLYNNSFTNSFLPFLLNLEDGNDDQKLFGRPSTTVRFCLHFDTARSLNICLCQFHVRGHHFQIITHMLCFNTADPRRPSFVFGIGYGPFGTRIGTSINTNFQFFIRNNVVSNGTASAVMCVFPCSIYEEE